MKKKYSCCLLVAISLLTFSCKKNHSNETCNDIKEPSGNFLIREIIGDTAFVADTIFRDNYVKFEAFDKYESVLWKLGSDPRDFTSPNFSLSFYTLLGTIPISFTGSKNTIKECFPNSSGSYNSIKNLTVVEQIEKPILTLSPLIGKYKGSFIDKPADTFTFRINYFDSSKYDTGVTGTKNFYWLSNMPNGYISNLGWSYPELLNGQTIEMGYKCFGFGDGSSIVQGKGWLSNDSVIISYGNNVVGRRKFIGKKL